MAVNVSSSPIVALSPQTSIKGKTTQPKGGTVTVNAFLGIPYAEPPVGELRFCPPKPKTLWTGERDCTTFGPICPQNLQKTRIAHEPFRLDVPGMSEDCLYLNVWTPNLDAASRLPVMLWIHGGGFFQGLGDIYDGTAIASFNNVAFVSFNYRLGPFGFMSTGDSVAPGNYGLWDQIEAMKWIQKYISVFGGDSDNVTIIGESAGAMSASLLVATDVTKGLFRRAICQSGVASSQYAICTQKEAKECLTEALKSLNFDDRTNEDILTFLRRKTPDDLLTAFHETGLKPVIDGNLIEKHPAELYSEGKFQAVDLMLGFNTHEGNQILNHYLNEDNPGSLAPTKENIRDIVKGVLIDMRLGSVDDIIEQVMKVYLNQETLETPERMAEAVTNICGDGLFVAPNQYVASIHSGRANTFVYLFAYRPSMSMNPEWITSDHGDDLFYSMGTPFVDHLTDVTFTPDDERMSIVMMRYWANFAKTGDPNGDGLSVWPRFHTETGEYIVLLPVPTSASRHQEINMEMWNKITRSLFSE